MLLPRSHCLLEDCTPRCCLLRDCTRLASACVIIAFVLEDVSSSALVSILITQVPGYARLGNWNTEKGAVSTCFLGNIIRAELVRDMEQGSKEQYEVKTGEHSSDEEICSVIAMTN